MNTLGLFKAKEGFDLHRLRTSRFKLETKIPMDWNQNTTRF